MDRGQIASGETIARVMALSTARTNRILPPMRASSTYLIAQVCHFSSRSVVQSDSGMQIRNLAAKCVPQRLDISSVGCGSPRDGVLTARKGSRP
jgi:hypothetical protein